MHEPGQSLKAIRVEKSNFGFSRGRGWHGLILPKRRWRTAQWGSCGLRAVSLEQTHSELGSSQLRTRSSKPKETACSGGTVVSPVPRAGTPGRSIYKTTDVSASLFLDAEIVGYRENIGNAFGLHLGNLFVHLTSDHPFQCDVTTIDDDVDRRHRAHCIHT